MENSSQHLNKYIINLSNQDRPLLTENELTEICDRLEQKHPLDRKIKFLLDVRGVLRMRAVRGNYIEFGCFDGRLLWAAYKILGTSALQNYMGCDTFSGEPCPRPIDERQTRNHKPGDFTARFDDVNKLLENELGPCFELVRGDFREKQIVDHLAQKGPFAVAIVDCNYLSSTTAALEIALRNCADEAVVYLDDFFLLISGDEKDIGDFLTTQAEKNFLKITSMGYYPPFGKSFFLNRKTP